MITELRNRLLIGLMIVSLPLFAGCGGAPTIDENTPPPQVEPGEVAPGPPTALEGGQY